MSTCFVIQRFDNDGPFDRRFDEVFSPAIKAAGLEPYRVDRDPGVSIPINDIETGIRNSILCLADITLDNPNVWFELGFAIAARKDVVLVCSGERKTGFPFDVGHRHITQYQCESPGDFAELQTTITARIKAMLEKEEKLELVANTSSIAPIEGLSQHEIVALVSIAENIESPDSHVSRSTIGSDMERSGLTPIATTLALARLLKKGLVAYHQDSDWNGNDYATYSITSEGMEWLLDNEDKLVLRQAPQKRESQVIAAADIPF